MRAARVDSTQTEIVAVLRGHGCSVVSLASMGKGVPDLLVGYAGRTHLVEVKSPKKIHHRKSAIRQSQTAFMDGWKGDPVVVVASVEDVDRCLESWRSAHY